jgi:peptidyl-prolyl cis-trans isomerase SDCCAG10
MGDLETNEHDMPLYPPKILKTEVLNNPFPDIVPRVKKVEKKVVEKKKKNAVKDYGLLSFGDEAEMDEQVVKPSTKGKSSHDLLNDPKLSKKKAVEVKPVAQEEIIPVGDTNATAFQNKMREKAKARIAALTSKPTEPTKTEEEPVKEEEQAPQKEKPKKLSFKASNADDKAGKDYLAQQRQKFLEKKRKTGTDREEEALKRVQMFSNRLLNGPPEKKRKVDEEEEGWQNHELKFDKTHTRETKKAEEDFEVYDPLTHTVEKGKSR